MPKPRAGDLATDGFTLARAVVSPTTAADLGIALGEMVEAGRGGGRNLLDHPTVRAWAMSPVAMGLARMAVGVLARPVRAILFDKTAGANWRVTWHQDLTIAVRDRIETPGFGPWSQKAGVWHVQPPVAVLEAMVALRLHLDPCGPDNGPVRVLPGSHGAGKLRESDYQVWRDRVDEQLTPADQGDVLLMRPLLLHASSPASSPHHRRVLHIEYAGCELPGDLQWHWAEPVHPA